jgi:hypothetical protein
MLSQPSYERGQEKPTALAISDSPAMRSANQERETLPVAPATKKGRCPLRDKVTSSAYSLVPSRSGSAKDGAWRS